MYIIMTSIFFLKKMLLVKRHTANCVQHFAVHNKYYSSITVMSSVSVVSYEPNPGVKPEQDLDWPPQNGALTLPEQREHKQRLGAKRG